ncbi:putative uncharacterized protein [Eggerthella sp. CAG:1427]|jgi:hypothetical protein|nr:putative uncharacterized protein [Eggerthella sp. CAG:1427]
MYTFLINENNTLTCSVQDAIMERSKMVDKLHFLADPTYKGIDMTDYTVNLEYVLPISKRYKTEILTKSDELYKNKLEYILPFDTDLTSEPGDIQIQLTFLTVTMDSDGTTVQHVRKVGPGVIHIVPIQNWSDLIPDAALSSVDQRLLAAEAMLKALSDRNAAIFDSKADNLSYIDQKLQLTANGKPIGNAVKITQESVETEDGSLRVVEF